MKKSTLWTVTEQYDNFNRTNKFFPINTMPATKSVYNFSEGEKTTLPNSFQYQEKTVSVADFLTDDYVLGVQYFHEIIHKASVK